MRVQFSETLTALLILIPSPLVFAQSKQDMAKCAVLEGSIERLSCFDTLAEKVGAQGTSEQRFTGSGKWVIDTEQSAIDDSKNVHVYLVANEAIPARHGDEVIPVLKLRCSEKRTEAYVNFDTYLGTKSTRVTTRLDKDKAQTAAWTVSTTNKAAFIPKPIQFIKSLMNKETLLIQVTPYGANTVMTSFDIRGLAESAKPLQAACSWK
jgi:type VI secretion system protein VasI